MSVKLLDNFEYSSDAIIQAAYVTNDSTSYQSYSESTIKTQGSYALKAVASANSESILTQETTQNDYDVGGGTSKGANYFVLAGNTIISKVKFTLAENTGSPTGTITCRIETNNAGLPSGTLADAGATKSITPTPSAENTFTFDTPFLLPAGTYWVVWSGETFGWGFGLNYGISPSGIGAETVSGDWVARTDRSYTYKIYSLTGSLFKTLTKTFASPIDLSGQKNVKFQVRASRTGSNFKIGLHDSGGTTTEVTPNVLSANTWQEINLDISAVSDANKDVIDSIIITITNADVANTIYIDNMYGLIQRKRIISV